MKYHWTVEFWWKVEQISGRLWRRFCPEGEASYWLDFLPAWAYRQRKKAEHRHPWC